MILAEVNGTVLVQHLLLWGMFQSFPIFLWRKSEICVELSFSYHDCLPDISISRYWDWFWWTRDPVCSSLCILVPITGCWGWIQWCGNMKPFAFQHMLRSRREDAQASTVVISNLVWFLWNTVSPDRTGGDLDRTIASTETRCCQLKGFMFLQSKLMPRIKYQPPKISKTHSPSFPPSTHTWFRDDSLKNRHERTNPGTNYSQVNNNGPNE